MSGEPFTDPLDTRQVTWSALLGHWIDFARSAVALPDDSDGRRMKKSVPDIIMLQAVFFSLQHLDELNPAQRALGLDRAEILISRHVHALTRRWADQLPSKIQELIDDARRQLQTVSTGSQTS